MIFSRPRSLRFQTILAVFLGLVLSHVVAIGIYAGDRGDVITRTAAEDMVERIAGTVILKPLCNRQPSDSMGEIGGRVLRDAA